MNKSKLVFLGLFLVAVPIVFQMALIAWMSSMLGTIQRECNVARQSRTRINRLSEAILKVTDFSFVVYGGKKAVSEAAVIKEIAEIEKEATELLESGSDITGENKAQLEKCKAALKELISLRDWALAQGRYGRTLEERYSIVPRLAAAGDKFTQEVMCLIETEKRTRAQGFDLSDVDRTRVQNWLFISIAISVLSSAIMAVFFSARIKVPINRMSENLKRLSNNEQLLPALNSDDELGALDRLIHTVGEETNKAFLRERSLIEKAADLICSLDEAGTFLTANPMAFRMLSIQPADLVGRRLNELTVAEDSFAADELINSSIKLNDFQSAELTLRRADGTTVDTRWSCLWSDEEGSLFCVAHDITKEKELAQMKLDFMNMISHDLRSPLTSVIGGLSMVESGIKGEMPPALNEEAASAVRSANKLVSFINDLLDFQKLDSGQMPLDLESTTVNQLIEEAVPLVAALAKDRSIELKYPKGEQSASVLCDRQKIVQVILNLLSNAIKFSKENSTVEIDVEEKADQVRISVTDSGPGIPEDMHFKIFEPFEQVHPSQHQGTGLGLAICKMMVEAHGGSIGVDSIDEKGSSFWFTIRKK